MQLTLFESEDESIDVDARSNAHGKRISFPCPTAQEIEIGEARCDHIKHCSECQRLIHELDKEVGYERTSC